MELKPFGVAGLPVLLSLTAGYVDTAGFLALQGLFTAHVTGNFVTLGAALVLGTSGVVSKLVALPVFCAVVLLTRFIGYPLAARTAPLPRAWLAVMLVLLALGAVLAITLGPFPNGDSPSAILTGMVLVAAMAIQNAVHRIHMASAPPTTLMTGTTTQIMIDIADLVHGVPADAAAAALARLRRMLAAVIAFAIGCAGAAILFAHAGMWCFALPPLLALLALPLTPPGKAA
ncbi:MAG TPA: YoaK family protein [Devosia sp.]|nr:YoaK family protein [Devosia sp.]